MLRVPRGRQVCHLPPCLKHQCCKAGSVPCSPVFPTSPQAAAEPRLMESTLLAVVISINAALLALAITCQSLPALFQLEISCQHRQLMSTSGEQVWSTFIHGCSEGWMPSLPKTLMCSGQASGTRTGTTGHQRAVGDCISPWPDYKLDFAFAKSSWPEKCGKALRTGTASMAASMLMVKLCIRKGCQ